MAQHDLELDTAVRDWVFIPLTLSILLMKLLTQYAHMVSATDSSVCLRNNLMGAGSPCVCMGNMHAQ